MDEGRQGTSISIARQANSRDIERRVRIAINELVSQGKTPSFYAVANAAHVARSTLYRKADLKELVDEARSATIEPSSIVEELESLKRETAELHDELKRMRKKRDDLACSSVGGSFVSYWVDRLDAPI